jgi:hypothetical protein
MITELSIHWKEIKGNKAVEFGVIKNDGSTRGTLIIGRGGLRWRGLRGHTYPTKSWDKLIDWLQERN